MAEGGEIPDIDVKKETVSSPTVQESVRRMFVEGGQDVEYLEVSDEDEADVDLDEVEFREKADFLTGARSLGFEGKVEDIDVLRQQVIRDVMRGTVPDSLIPDPLSAGIKEQVERQVS